MKREFAIHPDAHLVADLNVPYKCVGGAIIEAQRAGFKKIGFISEPPLRKGEQ
jgi:biopolymer transport protein ExbD